MMLTARHIDTEGYEQILSVATVYADPLVDGKTKRLVFLLEDGTHDVITEGEVTVLNEAGNMIAIYAIGGNKDGSHA